jgi:hypothetical protein
LEENAMRALVGFVVLAVSASAPDPTQPGSCPIKKEQWKAGDGEKLWGLKAGNAGWAKNQTPPCIGLSVEFGKDLKPNEVKELQQATAKQNVNGGILLQVHFFDEDGVVIYKCDNYGLQGDISGRKGDAFRILLPMQGTLAPLESPQNAEKVKKVELRMVGELPKETRK